MSTEQFAPEPYSHRAVLALKDVDKWSKEEKQTQLEHNRVLRSGFSIRPSEEIIKNAELTGTGWVTDYICPTPENELFVAVASAVVTDYEVGERSFNETAHQIHQQLLQKNFDGCIRRAEERFQQDFLILPQKRLKDFSSVEPYIHLIIYF
jgi:hypothetical protein